MTLQAGFACCDRVMDPLYVRAAVFERGPDAGAFIQLAPEAGDILTDAAIGLMQAHR